MKFFNSCVISWFCRTNDPLICRYSALNVVVSGKCFKRFPLKFYFRPLSDIRSNWKWNLNSRGPQQKTYLSFGTDFTHMIDVTESLIIVNENIAQNVEVEWKIFFYQWTMCALSSKQISVITIEWSFFPTGVKRLNYFSLSRTPRVSFISV